MRRLHIRVIASLLAFSLIIINADFSVMADDTYMDSTSQQEASEETKKYDQNDKNTHNEENNRTANVGTMPTINADGSVTLQSTGDFVALSSNWDKYADSINEIIIAPHDNTPLSLSDTGFMGFGTEDKPYAGKIGFAGTFTDYITLDKSLFNYLSQDADVGKLNLKASNNTKAPILADNFVKGDSAESSESHSISLKLALATNKAETEDGEKEFSKFGGIIGTMRPETALSLSVECELKDGKQAVKYAVEGSGNRGFFCNTMGDNSSLSVEQVTVNNNYNVTSSDADAGAFVGHMNTGASLTVNCDFTYMGVVTGKNNAGGLVGCADNNSNIFLNKSYSVGDGTGDAGGTAATINSTNGNAGGLIGKATDVSFTFGENISTVINATIAAKDGTSGGAAGGLIGSCIYNANTTGNTGSTGVAKNVNLNLDKFIIKKADITSGQCSGGAFGVLENKSEEGKITLTGAYNGSDNSGAINDIESSGKNSTHYGGLIGKYQADSLKASLIIEGLKVFSIHSTEKTSYGGVIACVDRNCYVQVKNLDIVVQQDSNNGSYFGGVIAYGTGSSLFDIGTVAVKDNKNSPKAAGTAYGGIIGNLGDGVLRLSGRTDLSGLKYSKQFPEYGQIVGTRGAGLIYALGNGLDYNETSNTGWNLVRNDGASYISDVGNWGEVVRLDGDKLSETKNAGEDSSPNLLYFNQTEHTVTVQGFANNHKDINNVCNFAAIALTYQCYKNPSGNESTNSGALILSDTTCPATWDIKLNADIDLTGTGILGLTRDNGESQVFTGSIDGGDGTGGTANHSITLDIGGKYGVFSNGTACSSDAGKNGCGQIYNHKYLGLLAKAGNSSITNLTVGGFVDYGMGDTDNAKDDSKKYYAGGLVANLTKDTGDNQAEKASTFTNVVSDVDVTLNGNNNHINKSGGFVGLVSSGVTLNFTGCKWSGSFTDNTKQGDIYIGGYVGCISDANPNEPGSIIFKNCSIGNGDGDEAAISVNSKTITKVGGILAATDNTGKANNVNEAEISIQAENFTVDGLNITSSATNQTGGLFGYDWYNVDFTADGINIKNANLDATKASFGGLVYEASGHWLIKGKGIKLGEESDSNSSGSPVVSFKGKTDNNAPSALLVCRGDSYRGVGKYALYMEIQNPGAYKIGSNVSVNLGSGNNEVYFDELLGISQGTNGNGVVSIATTDASTDTVTGTVNTEKKLNQTQCNTYQKQLGDDYKNPNTRYYYNVPASDDGSVKAEGNIESGEELLMWSIGQYCAGNLRSYFSKIGKDASVKVIGTIDLTGLSYYPVDYSGTITLDGADITFDYKQINTRETGNKPLNDEKRQHYRMQTGLLLNLIRTSTTNGTLKVENSTNSTSLSGSVGQIEGEGSGALIAGNMCGEVKDNKVYQASVTIDGLILDGIVVDGINKDNAENAYTPLLINKAGSQSNLNIRNVSTSEKYSESQPAATSLMGDIGNAEAKNMTVVFQNMKLDARTDSGNNGSKLYNTTRSIFTKATFMNSFMYDPNDNASSGSYTFKETDTVKQNEDKSGYTGNVTYGVEISNTDSGRNAGLQYYYLESNNLVEDIIWGTSATGSGDNSFAGGKYLRYVYMAEGSGATNSYHEIDINLQFAPLKEGCGTYDDPYVIRSGKQFETVADFIAKGESNGWEVNLPYSVVKTPGSLSSHGEDGRHYTYKSGSEKWTTKDADNKDLTVTKSIRDYMRNAYYRIADDIYFSESFRGIGGPYPDSDTFSGVIYGKKDDGNIPRVYVTAQNSTKQFGGLITFSQGSVVKDLILDFGGKKSTPENPEEAKALSITIESQGPSQERENQSFFGGVIGYVVGGDNIIDNVDIENLENPGASQKIISDGNLTDIGGYVGLIGGNLQSGGGVVFRNITKPGITEYANEVNEDTEAGNNSEAGNDTGADGNTGADVNAETGVNVEAETNVQGDAGTDKKVYYYRNPFVGRVLDGYACAEGCMLNNTDKNYKIPTLIEEADGKKLNISSSPTSSPAITVGSAQQLWVLSAIVNSGAGGGSVSVSGNPITYNNDAYNKGKARIGDYSKIGQSLNNDSDDDAIDNKYWGGNANKTKGQYSYLIKKYVSYSKIDDAVNLTNSKNHSVIVNADCNMTSYGNGFRGIGTTYQDNANKDIQKRTLWLADKVSVKTEEGKNPTNQTITYSRNIYEYASEEKVGWWAQGIGLFPVVAFRAATTVSYLTISGTASITYTDDRANKELDYIGETSAGGFAGMTANNSGTYNVTLSNVKAENLTVKGTKYSGGFFGVVGQSSRTEKGKNNITTISNVVGNYNFQSCGYNTITVEGGYSAGGFIGTYRNRGKTMNITGKTVLESGTIGWTRDSCLEMYKVIKNATDAKENGYSGGGGIIGYYYGGNLNVATSNSNGSSDSLQINKMYVFGPRFAYNCDYGLGGIIGLHALRSGGMTINNTTIKNSVIEVNMKLKYEGQHNKDETYYTTPACGLIKGYSKAVTTCNNIKVSNCAVLNAGFCGGLFGNQAATLTLNTAKINDLVVYSQGTGSYSGSSKVGGIMGSALGVDVSALTMNNVTVVSDGNTGLIEGMARSERGYTINYSNVFASGCVVATTQVPKAKYFIGVDTDPGSANNNKRDDSLAGSAGVFTGAAKHNNLGKIGYCLLNIYNAALDNILLGYYCSDEAGPLSYEYEWDNDDKFKFAFMDDNQQQLQLDESVIGVYNTSPNGTSSNGTPYSKIGNNKYDNGGYLGVITGAHNDETNGYIKVVGLSMKDGYYPCELNGNDDATFLKKSENNGSVNNAGNSNNNNYVIFADYSGKSFLENPNTDGTIGKINDGYMTSAAPKSPYVVVNAASSMKNKVYSSDNDNNGIALTGDGMNDEVKKSIVSDVLSSSPPHGKNLYDRVKYYDSTAAKGNRVSLLAKKFDPESGIYKDKLSTFFTASDSKETDYNGAGNNGAGSNVSDFDALLIDTTNSDEITLMLHEYLSVLTNSDQTGSFQKGDINNRAKEYYTSAAAYTYQWNKDKGKFVKTDKSSLLINSTTHKISVRAGAHDNQNKQFTVLDFFYKNPKSDKTEGYHVFIPVVVKKVLQTEFSIKMHSGSSDYADAYPKESKAILASYGEQFTAQLTYSYIWTAEEWNGNISSGTNFLWSYDKQVKLGSKSNTGLDASTTRYTLVDMNRRGQGNTFFTGTGDNLERAGNDAVLKFSSLPRYTTNIPDSSVYLADLLPLKIEDKADGELKKVTDISKATIRKWNVDTASFDYYGPKADNDPSGTKYYKITVEGAKDTEELKVSEVYYLTVVNNSENYGVVTQMATLGLEKMASSNENALPSKMKSTPGINNYTLGKFYEVTDVNITPTSKNSTGIMEADINDYIDLNLQATVSVPEADREKFKAFAENDDTFARFVVQMHKTGDTGSDQILADIIQVQDVTMNGRKLEDKDYSCEISNGMLYLLIKNKKCSAFLNTKIAANVRLAYEGDVTTIDNQFPLRAENENAGITFSVDASVAYTESSLDGSNMSGNKRDNKIFYREKTSSAEISYNAYNTVSEDGNVSQLGINGNELTEKKGVWITTKGMYNAAMISGLDTINKDSDRYPNHLVGTLRLQKKTGEVYKCSYKDVKMSDYFKYVKLNKGTEESPGDIYKFKINLTPEQVKKLSYEQLEMDLEYFVKSDSEIEALGNEGQYANYKVILSAHLENSKNEKLIDDMEDYIIYTNAKLFNGVISTKDFDQKSGN